ncbi:RICIN domain-containing protein [Longitalea luteola]|uniref:RICIN domain-containing protein n=1 Tax=Longitalea luteola TaxID=2812563 RepID=UPI001A973F2B|nr:RICIN domain-containing protein [Longitalea luteola]
MRKRKLLALTTVGIFLQLLVQAQQTILGLETYFEEAYWRYPNIPKGVLEAAAYSASRLTNLQPSAGQADVCTGMPQRYGLYALIENGHGYFKNNLLTVCRNSGITPEQYKKDVRLQVLAVAKFLSREASMRPLDIKINAEGFAVIFDKLAEFPDDSSAINKYALALYKYDIYDHLRSGFTTPSLKRAPVKVHWEQLFPAPLLRKLQAPAIQVHAAKDSVLFQAIPVNADGTTVFTANHIPDISNIHEATEAVESDYTPAIYIKANAANYQSGRNGTKISHVTIHTAQGSYAAAISWLRNANAHQSAHYIVRASDGQITQMVKEHDMALHVHTANAYTVGVEHEGYMEYGNKWYSDKMYMASAALVRDICIRRAIDERSCFRGPATTATSFQTAGVHIKGHQHYSGNAHADPGKYWNWNLYADMLLEKYVKDADPEVAFKTIPNGIYRITNVNSKKVLNTRDCAGHPLTKITQGGWTGRDCERWRFEYAGDGWYKITSLVSGRAMEVPGGSRENVQIYLKDIKDQDCQLWRILEAGSKGELRLVNKASGKTLDVFGGSFNNGAAVLQTAWAGKSRQKWTLTAAPSKVMAEEDSHRFRKVQLDSTEAMPAAN